LYQFRTIFSLVAQSLHGKLQFHKPTSKNKINQPISGAGITFYQPRQDNPASKTGQSSQEHRSQDIKTEKVEKRHASAKS